MGKKYSFQNIFYLWIFMADLRIFLEFRLLKLKFLQERKI